MTEPSTTRSRFGIAVVGLTVGCAVGLAASSLFGTSPTDAARSRAVPELPAPTTQVEEQQLQEVVRASCEPRRDVTTVTAPEVPGDRPLVVTDTSVTAGDQLETGTLLATVSGHPIITFVTEVPFYRDLGVGDTGDDVGRLEDALARVDLIDEEPDTTFDTQTATAMTQLFREAGLDTSALTAGDADFLLSASQSVRPGSTVLEVLAEIGQRLQPDDAIVTIGGPQDGVACSVPASVRMSAGDKVDLQVGEETVGASVRSVGPIDEDTGMRQLIVTPDDERSEPLGSAAVQVVTNETSGEVLTVPVGALFTSPDGGLEVRKDTPDGYQAVPVEPGIVAGGFVEIDSSDLTSSDEVHLHAATDPTSLSGEDGP